MCARRVRRRRECVVRVLLVCAPKCVRVASKGLDFVSIYSSCCLVGSSGEKKRLSVTRLYARACNKTIRLRLRTVKYPAIQASALLDRRALRGLDELGVEHLHHRGNRPDRLSPLVRRASALAHQDVVLKARIPPQLHELVQLSNVQGEGTMLRQSTVSTTIARMTDVKLQYVLFTVIKNHPR